MGIDGNGYVSLSTLPQVGSDPMCWDGSGASVSASVNNKGGAGASGPLLLLLGLLGAIAYYIRRKNHG